MRPLKLSKEKQIELLILASDPLINKTALARQYGITRQTIHNLLARHEQVVKQIK